MRAADLNSSASTTSVPRSPSLRIIGEREPSGLEGAFTSGEHEHAQGERGVVLAALQRHHRCREGRRPTCMASTFGHLTFPEFAQLGMAYGPRITDINHQAEFSWAKSCAARGSVICRSNGQPASLWLSPMSARPNASACSSALIERYEIFTDLGDVGDFEQLHADVHPTPANIVHRWPPGFR